MSKKKRRKGALETLRIAPLKKVLRDVILKYNKLDSSKEIWEATFLGKRLMLETFCLFGSREEVMIGLRNHFYWYYSHSLRPDSHGKEHVVSIDDFDRALQGLIEDGIIEVRRLVAEPYNPLKHDKKRKHHESTDGRRDIRLQRRAHILSLQEALHELAENPRTKGKNRK